MASPDMLMAGEADVQDYLATYAGCKEVGVWPSYSDDFVSIELPPWAKEQAERMRGGQL